MFENQSAAYWLKNHADLVQDLADKAGKTAEQVAADLAYTAGDHSDMTDSDVVETFQAEHDLK